MKQLILFVFLAAKLYAFPVIAAPLDDALNSAFEAGKLPGLHGTISELGDTRLTEVYFVGEDERWGQPLGERSHGPDTLHDLRSVTKSIVGLLYGIALAEELVPPPDASLYVQFPEYIDLQGDPQRDAITIADTLSMQMGLDWNEDLPYTDPRNSEIAMERAEDRFRFILEQPVKEEPGQKWTYSGGAVVLIGELIERGSGVSLDTFAKERTQIVPADWLQQSMQPHVEIDQRSSYGYLWYVVGNTDNPAIIAVGNGGQRLTIQPKHDLVTASFAGRYNDPTSWQLSFSVLIDYVVPEAKGRLVK